MKCHIKDVLIKESNPIFAQNHANSLNEYVWHNKWFLSADHLPFNAIVHIAQCKICNFCLLQYHIPNFKKYESIDKKLSGNI